ncbi:MAG TPA: FixH family protein [Dongiaceae bacterium]|nr:FixH family protein [Dongiaceae bacterium]
MATKLRETPPRWSKLIPWMFVGGFAIVIAVNASLIYFAQSSFSGLDTEHPYERGLDYNRTLEAAAAQEKLGWHGKISLAKALNGQHELAVLFADKAAGPIEGLEVTAYLRRPSNQGLDQTIQLHRQGSGRYAAEIALPAPGQWDVRIVARQGETSWQESERLFVP